MFNFTRKNVLHFKYAIVNDFDKIIVRAWIPQKNTVTLDCLNHKFLIKK